MWAWGTSTTTHYFGKKCAYYIQQVDYSTDYTAGKQVDLIWGAVRGFYDNDLQNGQQYPKLEYQFVLVQSTGLENGQTETLGSYTIISTGTTQPSTFTITIPTSPYINVGDQYYAYKVALRFRINGIDEYLVSHYDITITPTQSPPPCLAACPSTSQCVPNESN